MTTYNNPSLDQNTKGRYKVMASVGAGIFLLLLLLLTFWRFFSKLDPKPEPGGLEASFGNVVISGGGGTADPTPDPEPENTNVNTEDNSSVSEVETNDNIKSEVVNTEETSTQKPTSTEKPTSSESSTSSNASTKSYVPSFGDFGTGKGAGQQGTKHGKKDDLGKVNTGGNGSDGPGGNGTGLVGERRSCIGKTCGCDLSPSDIEKITNYNTKVYVQVTIAPAGDVLDAKIPKNAFLRENANPTPEEKKIALKCARQYKFNSSDNKTRGVVIVPLKQK